MANTGTTKPPEALQDRVFAEPKSLSADSVATTLKHWLGNFIGKVIARVPPPPDIGVAPHWRKMPLWASAQYPSAPSR